MPSPSFIEVHFSCHPLSWPRYSSMWSSLSIPCSPSDFRLFRQGTVFTHLDSFPYYDLVILTDGSVPFRFGKGGSGVLANCPVCGAGTNLFGSAGPVGSRFSAITCAILLLLLVSAALTSLQFFSMVSLFLLHFPLLRLSFFLIHSGTFSRNYPVFPPFLFGYNRS